MLKCAAALDAREAIFDSAEVPQSVNDDVPLPASCWVRVRETVIHTDLARGLETSFIDVGDGDARRPARGASWAISTPIVPEP